MGIVVNSSSPEIVNASSIASGLDLRRVGPGRWRGPCPSCGGNTRFSLDDRNGKPLMRCWADCAQPEIINALRALGLWPEKQQRTFTLDERRRYARARAEASELAVLALDWYRAELAALSDRKRAAVNYDSGRFNEAELASAAHREHWLTRLTPGDVVAEYRQQRRENPASAHRLQQISADWRRACHGALLRLINEWGGVAA